MNEMGMNPNLRSKRSSQVELQQQQPQSTPHHQRDNHR